MRKETGRMLNNFVVITAMFMLLLPGMGMGADGNPSSRANKTVEGWSEDIPISTLDDHGSYNPTIASSGGNVYVIWSDMKDEEVFGGEIYFRKSMDSGNMWGSITRLTYADSYSSYPVIATNGNNVHVVWQDARDGFPEIYYKHSSNNGDDWSEDTPLTSYDGLSSCDPSIAVNGDNIHVVWKDARSGGDYGGLDIYYKRSTDNGVTWDDGQGNIGQDRRLTFNTNTWSDMPLVAVNNDTIHVVWCDEDSGTYEEYYMRSLDNGTTWSNPVSITPLDGIKSGVWDIAVEGENLYAVGQDERWEGGLPYDSLWLIKSEDGGEHWSEKTILVPEQGADVLVSSASIAVSNNNLYVAWYDGRDYVPSSLHTELYYKNSSDGGNKWEGDTRLTYGGNVSQPKIIESNSKLHVVWMDKRTGNYEVYYKRSPDFNHPPEIVGWYPLENLTITENQNLTFMVNASDPDNNTLSYQWYLSNESVGRNQNSYIFTANSTCSGTFTIRVEVSDGEFIVNHSWTVTVVNIGQLYNSITDLQNHINLLNLTNSGLNETVNNLTQNLGLIWNELNQSVQNNSELRNQTLSLMDTLSVIWGNLNQSKMNETSLLNQINELQQENTKLKNELNKTKNKETPWIGVGETLIIISLVCIMVLVYRKKHKGG